MKWKVMTVCTWLFMPWSLFGEEQMFSGNLTATTNYVFRGLTQTDDTAAVQGGIDFNYSGFGASVWMSNVRPAASSVAITNATATVSQVYTVPTSAPTIETDFMIGYTHHMGNMSFGLNLIQYWYANYGNWDTREANLKFAWENETCFFGFDYYISDDWFSTDSISHYLVLSTSHQMNKGMAQGFGWEASAGLSLFDEAKVGTDTIWDWKAGLTYGRKDDWKVGGYYADTDSSEYTVFASGTKMF